MNIKETVANDIKTSMKSGNKVRLETVRSINAEITNFEKANPGKELNMSKILKSLESKRKQSVDSYIAGGDSVRADLEKAELTIITEYIDTFLPKQMSLEETKVAVGKIIADNNFTKTDMGKIMGEIKKVLGAQVDMKLANEAVKSILV